MTPAQRKSFEEALRALEAELLGQTPLKLDPNRSYEAHPADAEDEQPLNEMLQAIASGRNRQQAVELEGVRRALAKLRDSPDLFGLCEECEEPVAAPRLKARPQVRWCLACQTERESDRGGPTRRKLTDYR
jgi:DnaK suppressor protein